MSKLSAPANMGLGQYHPTYANPTDPLLVYVGYIKISVLIVWMPGKSWDGADRFTIYRRIILPMLKPMHATTLIITAFCSEWLFMLPPLILNKDSRLASLPIHPLLSVSTSMTMGPSFASYIVGIVTITIVHLLLHKNAIRMSNGSEVWVLWNLYSHTDEIHLIGNSM